MKKILVPTDFSENAFVAGNVAIKIAKTIQAEVEFIHSYSFVNSSFQSEEARKMHEEESLKEAELEMSKYLSRFEFDSIVHSTCYSNRPLIRTIENIGAESDVKLIVMGTNGASGLNYILGSNSLEVAKKSKIPLLIVPLNTDVSNINKIVFFTDFQTQDFQTLKSIQDLFANSPLQFDVVHFQDKDVFTVEENELRLENHLVEIQKQLMSDKVKGYVYPQNANIKSVSLVINEKHPDIISLSLIDRSFWDSILEKSLAKQIILNPFKPVFILNKN